MKLIDQSPARPTVVRAVISMILGTLLAAPLASAHNGEDHGNHDALHEGFVMMYEDLHFELAAKGSGKVEVYYTDAVREPLPAATVSDVVVEIERTDGSIENLNMQISDDGAFWTGNSMPISDKEDIIRIGFVFQDKPLVLDVPFSAMPPRARLMKEGAAEDAEMPMSGAAESMHDMEGMEGMDHDAAMPAMDHSAH